MPRSNFQGGCFHVSRGPFLAIIIISTIIGNEVGWNMMTMVEGRTWPRIVQHEQQDHEHQPGCHHKEEIYSTSFPTTSTTPTTPPLKKDYNTLSPGLLAAGAPNSRINSSESPILPAPLHLEKAQEKDDDGNRSGVASSGLNGNYQDFNGNVSLRCNNRRRRPSSDQYSSHNSSSGNNDNYNRNGVGGRWWPSTIDNSTNCLAGPFHLGADVNESVYNALCPLSSSATNGKFPIQGVHCGAGAGELFTVCSGETKEGSQVFTLHECADEKTFLNAETGGCERKSGQEGEIKSLPSTAILCPMDREETTTVSQNAILDWLLHQTQKPAAAELNSEESRREEVVLDLQKLDEKRGSSEQSNFNDDEHNQFENLCKSSASLFSLNHGLHAHPQECDKYIHCSADGKGSFFIKSCGPGTVFNPKLLICDWPANVPQCSGGGNGNELLRRKRTLADDSKSEFETGKKNRCNFSGIQPDPEFCNKYRLCSAGGVETTHTCGIGTVFNQQSGVCDFSNEVDCANKKSDLGSYGCDKEDKYRAPHPDYCHKFIECEAEVLAVKSCPPATLYDREAERCDHAYKVTCRKPISLEHDIDVNWKSPGPEHLDEQVDHDTATPQVVVIKRKRRTSAALLPNWLSRTGRDNKLNLACEFNYIAPHPSSCTQFVECEQGRIFVKRCGPGTAFNPLLGQCDWPHNVREPDTGDCTRYRQCSIRNGYETRSCARGQFFDRTTRKCVRGDSYEIQRCSQGTRQPISTTRRPLEPPPAA